MTFAGYCAVKSAPSPHLVCLEDCWDTLTDPHNLMLLSAVTCNENKGLSSLCFPDCSSALPHVLSPLYNTVFSLETLSLILTDGFKSTQHM